MNFFQILRLLFSSLQKYDDHILCLIGYLFEQPPLCICKAFPCIFLSICCVMISSEIEILYPAGKFLSLKVNNPENHQKISETNLFPRLLLLRVNKSNCKKDSETRRAAQKKQKPAKPESLCKESLQPVEIPESCSMYSRYLCVLCYPC